MDAQPSRAGVNEGLSLEILRVQSQALQFQNSKNFDAAANLWHQFLQKHPGNADALSELGGVALSSSQYEDALKWFSRALGVRPDLVSAKAGSGTALRHLNRFEEAASILKMAVAATPNDALICSNLGASLGALQRHEEALVWLQRASDLCPGNADYVHQLGKVLQTLKRNEEAIEAYRRATALRPKYIDALLDLGGLLQEARRFDEAAITFQKVVDLEPNHCNGWLGVGAALLGVRRYAESLAAFRRAITIQPGSAVAYCNMSLALSGLGRTEEAIEACRKAIFIEPGSTVATFNMGTMLLSLGNYGEGWPAYNYRYAMHGEKWLREEAHAAPWMGEALTGKSIIVLGEQGYGDELQFSRYLSELSNLGARVFLIAPERLHRLFKTLAGAITLLSEIPDNSRFDFQCPLMNLPGVFEQLGLPMPARVPYLAAEPGRVARWKNRIGDGGFRVGIVWQGNRYDSNDVRSFPLAALRPVAKVPGVRLISFQIGGGTDQLANLPSDMQVETLDADFDQGEDSFLDSAAAAEVVDLCITCDTSMAHLIGALARPLWIALPEFPEWRWQYKREDSVWYPTARLFRQTANGDWDGVFLRMAEALTELLDAQQAAAKNESYEQLKTPSVEVSWGELLDKISILEIKAERMNSPVSLANVRRELEHLKSTLAALTPLPLTVDRKRASLRATNEKLWDLEDAIRACEAEQRFDSHFIDIARSIYVCNDERAKLKQQINALMKSSLVEEKEYRTEGKRHGSAAASAI
jgi:tetratricopeptide (TPR) repeat protein